MLPRHLPVDLGDYRRTVFVAGTGRSGTTWVQNVVNYRNSFRVMFEPFHTRKVGCVEGWSYRQYIRRGDRSEKFMRPARRILSGRVRNAWVDQFNRRLVSRRRCIKAIRAHLLLNWMKDAFPEIPIVLVLRHPCAVASSKLKLGWDTHLDEFLRQDDLMHDFLGPFRAELKAARDPFDQHVSTWCIENYVPLVSFAEGEILVTFYETLLTDFEAEAARVLTHVGEPMTPDVLAVSRQPSVQSRVDSAIVAGGDVLESWRRHVTDEQVRRALEICAMFGLDALYGEGSRPLVDGRDVLGLLSRAGGPAAAGRVIGGESAPAL